MHQSSTYERILREGRQEGLRDGHAQGRIIGARRWVQRQGTIRFGVPSPECIATLEAITDVERLEGLGERLLDPDLKNWDDLLRGS